MYILKEKSEAQEIFQTILMPWLTLKCKPKSWFFALAMVLNTLIQTLDLYLWNMASFIKSLALQCHNKMEFQKAKIVYVRSW